MSVITLTSDYGLLDHRVAAIKGAILTMNEEIKIVDITHQIEAYNLSQTAYIVRNAYKYFPKNSVHIIAVDSFYRKERKYLVYRYEDQYFMTADNGIMGLIFHDIKPESIVEITLNNRFDDEVNLPAVDIFVPAAVHLCNGGLPELLGRPFSEPKEIFMPRAIYHSTEKMLVGEIIYIDNFGNAVSNISKQLFQKNIGVFSSCKIRFRNMKLSKIHHHYTDFISNWENEVEYHGKPTIVFNENDWLEISIYKGSATNGAKSLLGLSVGEKVFVEFFE